MSTSKPIHFAALGAATPANAAASQVVSAADQYPHLQRNIERPVHARTAPELTPNEVYERINANAVPKGNIDRTVRTDADVAALAARQATQAALRESQATAATGVDAERLNRLERLVERLGADLKQLMAKVAELQSTVDGIQGGGT